MFMTFNQLIKYCADTGTDFQMWSSKHGDIIFMEMTKSDVVVLRALDVKRTMSDSDYVDFMIDDLVINLEKGLQEKEVEELNENS